MSSEFLASASILETLFRHSHDAITVQDLDGKILAWNRGAERMYGYAAAEALGMNISAIAPEGDAGALAYLTLIRAGRDVPSREVRRRAKDGRILNVLLTTTRVTLDGSVLVATTERDVTERRRQEQALRFELNAMARLHRISSLYLTEQRQEVILGEILDAAIEIAEAAFGNIQILDPASGDLVIVQHRGFPDAWIEYWNRVSRGHGVCGTALERRARVIVEDVERSPIFAGSDALAVQLAAGVRAVQSTPLLGRAGEPIGMLSTHYTEPRRPPERALAMLDLLARQAVELFERARADAALRRSEATAAGILAASADALISVDAQMRIQRWNAAASAMFGYGPGEAIGAALDLVIPERYRAEHRRNVADFLAGPAGARTMDHRSAAGRRANGDEFPISATISKFEIEGSTIMTVSVRDVTEARRTEVEQALLAELGGALASAEYDTTLQNIATLVATYLAELSALFVEDDAELRRVAVASRDPARRGAALEMTATPQRRAPGHPAWEAFDAQRTVVAQVGEGTVLYAPFVVGTTCRGVLGLASTSHVFDARAARLAEEIARRCALFLENARLHRVEQQAVRARDTVLAVVAHDLRSPLNTIGLQAELLQRLDGPRAPAAAILRGVNRMTRLIGDLLDVTRLEAGRFPVDVAPVPAAALVASARESLSSQVAERGLAFRHEAPDDLPRVSADPPRIQQVFDNLVGNAIKFTEHGDIELGARARADDVEFWVGDTGCGIAPDHLEHVFDRFWQARPAGRSGAGLGLAIAKGIVEAHGGRMRVESTRGAGTTVFFTLPVAGAPHALASPHEGAQAQG